MTRYGQWTEDGPHQYCGDEKRGLRIICSPYSIRPERHVLLKGNGDGTFRETTEEAGVLRRDGRGLGVVAADINGDGWVDLYVANDGCPNFLFLNRKDGTFADATETSGAATDASGAVQGSMGVDVQDADGDGRPDLFVTNFRGQYNTLYQNIDGQYFQDISARAGLVKDSLPFVGWGCGLADFDNDGLGRPDGRQRRGGRQPPLVRPGDRLRAACARLTRISAAAVSPAWATRAPSSKRITRPAGWPWATSTMTATSTPSCSS